MVALKVLLIALLVVLVVGGSVLWGRWEFRECRKVGHSSAYCLAHISR